MSRAKTKTIKQQKISKNLRHKNVECYNIMRIAQLPKNILSNLIPFQLPRYIAIGKIPTGKGNTKLRVSVGQQCLWILSA